jgi:hypothetical protein
LQECVDEWRVQLLESLDGDKQTRS